MKSIKPFEGHQRDGSGMKSEPGEQRYEVS